jgi:hypothetical protein
MRFAIHGLGFKLSTGTVFVAFYNYRNEDSAVHLRIMKDATGTDKQSAI